MIADSSRFSIKFWGVRGSIPCPGTTTVRYGGNTSCVEMRVGGKRLVFDGGTGLRLLGEEMLSNLPTEAHLFFTHSHWDHIQGFPFFAPAFIPGNCFHVYGIPSPNGATIKQRLHDQMLHPNFPVPLQIMQANLKFYDLEVGEQIRIGDINIRTGRLNHPGEAVGYRVDWQGRSAAYITDTEHFPDRLDDNVLQLAQEVDVLIIDATYTDDEYHNAKFNREGWGHSTWQEGIKIAKAASVGQLVLFHHDPSHCDQMLDEIGKSATLAFSKSLIAVEGLQIEI
jgi:phosphoribosyl 1,2-cyclic phosphodiesterase